MTKLQITLLLAVAIAVSLTIPLAGDFQFFYMAGRDVLSGINPYSSPHYFNPIHVAVAFAPLSILPYELAARLNAGLMFIAYVIALYRLLKRRVLWVALLAPFWLVITYYGNLDALVLLGVTLPAPIGVWLLISKPQIGLFAAALMLWKYRSWKLAVAVCGVLVASLAMGMIHGGLATDASMSLWPYGIVLGLPLLYFAWLRRDTVLALGAAAFLSPYCTVLNWCAALPLFRVNRRVMIVGVMLSWAIFGIWRVRL